ncbi:hypothetical protein GCM10007927_41960 [Sulfitobacter pacificus]|uniref:Uncharacterized protein n=1 Tax=Sulfitobacter pacificus TaxID=1499314 RepID=A0ABQ5VR57_9RHOB|nr:hypothetical protein GCM10007927_41960 [Sulfitobacter pacificus]
MKSSAAGNMDVLLLLDPGRWQNEFRYYHRPEKEYFCDLLQTTLITSAAGVYTYVKSLRANG